MQLLKRLAFRTQDMVTPDAFAVAPDLLGLPLARPWRRLAAMLIDLSLVGILAQVGGVVLGLGITGVLGRLAWRGASRAARIACGAGAALALLATLVGIVAWWQAPSSRAVTTRAGDDLELILPPKLVVASIPDLIAIDAAKDDETARRAGSRIVQRVLDSGTTRDELEELLVRLEETGRESKFARSLRAALAKPTDAAGTDAATAAPLEPAAIDAATTARIATLERQVAFLRRQARDATDELAKARERPSFLHAIMGIADDLGIGVGWSALYFTVAMAAWRGRTPGKRLLRLRVLRLDGRPMTWWTAFERWGGYAASVSTGLLGFAQVAWDRNRQALHDKIVETVVVQWGRGDDLPPRLPLPSSP